MEKQIMEIAVPGRRKRGRPRRWMDLAREDMERVEAREEMKWIRSNGKYFCAVVTLNREKPNEEEAILLYRQVHFGASYIHNFKSTSLLVYTSQI